MSATDGPLVNLPLSGGFVDGMAYTQHRGPRGGWYYVLSPEHARRLAQDNEWPDEVLARVLRDHEAQLKQLAISMIEEGL